MANIKTLNPTMAKVPCEYVPLPNRSDLVQRCKTCPTGIFKGPYWRFECDKCNPDWGAKWDRTEEREQQRKYRQRMRKRLTAALKER